MVSESEIGNGKPLSKRTQWQIGLLLLLLLGAVLSFFGFQLLTEARQPLPEAVEALESDGLVKVTQDPWLTFAPTKESPDTG